MIIWQKTIDGGGFEAFPDLQTTTDGNFVLAAHTDSFSQNALVMKFDGAGNTIWSKRYGGPGFEGIRGIQQTQDGGYIAVGWTQKTTTTDLWLLKLSPSGSIQWQYQYGGSNHDVGQSLVVGNEGNLFVAGYTYSFGSGGIDIWLLKLNAAGKILFEKTYGGTDHDWPIYAGIARDGGIFVTGLNRLASRFRQTAFVLKLNSSGELNSCSRLTLANSKAALRATTATSTVVQFNITNTNLLELSTDEIRITNGLLRSITDCNLITAVNPSSAPPGTLIQLSGLGFGNNQGDSQIFIGQRSTGNAISWSDTKIVLRIPNDAQTAGLTFQNKSVKTVPLEYPISDPA